MTRQSPQTVGFGVRVTGHAGAQEPAGGAVPNPQPHTRYGVLCWEIFHCRCPYAETGLDQMQIAAQVLKNGIRPRMSSRTPPKTAEFIKALWNKDPSARIQTFTAVRTTHTLNPNTKP
ncbi:hypothetical protein T484DRAFT_2564744 [Baffinella frigidus]|nr:hypothetical protein T484DRAFT_2564744 [Cryptophyta sp. CCMP2293]